MTLKKKIYCWSFEKKYTNTKEFIKKQLVHETLWQLQPNCNWYTKVRARSSSAPLHKSRRRKTNNQGKSESEEYDTLGSDSDVEIGTSSRTQSSNDLIDSHQSVIPATDDRANSTHFLALIICYSAINNNRDIWCVHFYFKFRIPKIIKLHINTYGFSWKTINPFGNRFWF